MLQFYKLCRDCRILDNNMTYPDIDLLYLRCTRPAADVKSSERTAAFSAMNFEQVYFQMNFLV